MTHDDKLLEHLMTRSIGNPGSWVHKVHVRIKANAIIAAKQYAEEMVRLALKEKRDEVEK